jgi:hypothetical protein
MNITIRVRLSELNAIEDCTGNGSGFIVTASIAIARVDVLLLRIVGGVGAA